MENLPEEIASRGGGVVPKQKDTVEQSVRTRLSSHVPRRRVMARAVQQFEQFQPVAQVAVTSFDTPVVAGSSPARSESSGSSVDRAPSGGFMQERLPGSAADFSPAIT